jgi:hypothetical protein
LTQYYYFVASLPSLGFGGAPPMRWARFAGEFPLFLNADDAAIVAAAVLEHPPDDPDAPPLASEALAGWRAWDRALRNELARLRAQALGRDAAPWTREAFPLPEAVAAARAAFAAPSPLDAEIALERARWETLDQLRGTHHFDREALVVYSLQLQIAERLAAFESETAAETYPAAYAGVMAGNGARE